MDERWGEEGDALESVRRVRRGNATEIAQSSRRSSTMQQRIRAIPQRSLAMWEKVGRFRMKVPLFAQKVSDFSAPLGRKRE